MLDESIEYLSSRERQDSSFTWEIIVVDDGSKDKLYEVVMPMVRKHGSNRLRLMTLAINQGKGAAVTKGVLVARGRCVSNLEAS